MVVKQERKKLKIDKRLPQIMLPPKARAMFINWWNEDIRFEQTIPHAFEQGYIIIDYNYADREEELLVEKKEDIKSIAQHFHCTYRMAESMFKDLLKCFSRLIVYFKFINENSVEMEIYDSTEQVLATMQFGVGASEPEPKIVSDDILFEYGFGIRQLTYPKTPGVVNTSHDEEQKQYFMQSMKCLLYLIVTSFWYITTTKSNKYIYENKSPVVIGRKKNVVKVSDTKTINTPIYDFNKIRVVKTEHLQTRKKGWTYSHSFQVHGHFRHYKNGKTIFISEYVKGKDKEFKSQQIILDPKNTQ